MSRAHCPQQHSQHGAALLISLIFLAVTTLLVLSMMRTSILQLRISGSTETLSVTRTNAEVAIVDFLDANAGRFGPGFATLPANAGGAIFPPTALSEGNVALVVTQTGCGTAASFTNQMGSGSLQTIQFDIAATATVARGGRSTVHQGVETLAPPGSC
jgi:Tfp pilus assembly protein PilX